MGPLNHPRKKYKPQFIFHISVSYLGMVLLKTFSVTFVIKSAMPEEGQNGQRPGSSI